MWLPNSEDEKERERAYHRARLTTPGSAVEVSNFREEFNKHKAVDMKTVNPLAPCLSEISESGTVSPSRACCSRMNERNSTQSVSNSLQNTVASGWADDLASQEFGSNEGHRMFSDRRSVRASVVVQTSREAAEQVEQKMSSKMDAMSRLQAVDTERTRRSILRNVEDRVTLPKKSIKPNDKKRKTTSTTTKGLPTLASDTEKPPYPMFGEDLVPPKDACFIERVCVKGSGKKKESKKSQEKSSTTVAKKKRTFLFAFDPLSRAVFLLTRIPKVRLHGHNSPMAAEESLRELRCPVEKSRFQVCSIQLEEDVYSGVITVTEFHSEAAAIECAKLCNKYRVSKTLAEKQSTIHRLRGLLESEVTALLLDSSIKFVPAPPTTSTPFRKYVSSTPWMSLNHDELICFNEETHQPFKLKRIANTVAEDHESSGSADAPQQESDTTSPFLPFKMSSLWSACSNLKFRRNPSQTTTTSTANSLHNNASVEGDSYGSDEVRDSSSSYMMSSSSRQHHLRHSSMNSSSGRRCTSGGSAGAVADAMMSPSAAGASAIGRVVDGDSGLGYQVFNMNEVLVAESEDRIGEVYEVTPLSMEMGDLREMKVSDCTVSEMEVLHQPFVVDEALNDERPAAAVNRCHLTVDVDSGEVFITKLLNKKMHCILSEENQQRLADLIEA